LDKENVLQCCIFLLLFVSVTLYDLSWIETYRFHVKLQKTQLDDYKYFIEVLI